jgi:peptidoglycan/LPS O-acetylase OafA/YrhL
MKNIPELDGFRAIAITMVIFFHYGIYIGNSYVDVVAGAGWLGVPLFFIMSGFLISLPYIKKAYDQAPLPSTSNFYKKRILRIFPLYYFSLVLFVVINYIFQYRDITVDDIAKHIFFIDNFYPERLTINSVYWSLAVEIQFYILFPVIGFVLYYFSSKQKIVKAICTIAAVILASIGYRIYVCMSMDITDHDLYMKYIYCNTFANFESFGYGILAAFLFVLQKKGNPLNKHVQLVLFIFMVVCVYFVMYYSFNNGVNHLSKHPFVPVVFYSLLNILMTSMIILVLSTSNNFINKVLSLKPLVVISTLSYSLYIWHLPILYSIKFIVEKHELKFNNSTLTHICVVTLSLFLSVLLSMLTYNYIEKYFIEKNKTI